jgi:hypothetical protein
VRIIVDLPVEPGVYTEQTPRGAKSQWKDADKVRFRYGLPEKIGGWTRLANVFIGLARKIWDWTSLDSRNWVGFGTEAKLYLVQDEVQTDITPMRSFGNLTNPFTTLITNPIVTVVHVNHGAQANDYVRYAGATAVGGLTINGQYKIVTVIDGDSYTINAGTPAGGSATGGGTVAYEYDITAGGSSAAFGQGWGVGPWGESTWNTPRVASSLLAPLRTWSMDNWGEDLMANPRGGSIYWWDRTTGPNARAALLVGAPIQATLIIISQRDLHMFAMGCTDAILNTFDPMLIRWCSRENFNDWIPSSSNTSGDLRVSSGSKIVAACKTRGELVLWTDKSVHQITYIGGQSVYGLTPMGENISILGPNAFVEVDSRVFFMTETDFYVYDGVPQPMPCMVRAYVFDNLNVFQKDKVFGGLNKTFNEVWFFYPAKANNVWIETDFSAGLNPAQYTVQTMAGTQRYSVALNGAGYVYLASYDNAGGETVNTYESIYMLRNAAMLATPLESEYEMMVVISDTTAFFGVAMDVIDLNSAADTLDDNIKALLVTVDLATSSMYFTKTDALGATSTLANAAGFYDLGLLATPISLTVGNTYAITMTRTNNTIKGYIYDEASGTNQLVATITLSAGEIAAYLGTGVAGAILRPSSQSADFNDTQLLSFRAAPAGVLIAQSAPGAAREVNRYVAFNYQEQHWTIGNMIRTAWHEKSPVYSKPYAAGPDNYLYQHETGSDDNGSALTAYAETYDMEIPESGENLMHVDQLIPDFLDLDGTVNIKLKGKKYPQGQVYQEKGPYPVTASTAKISTRIRGRQIALRIESTTTGAAWRMGTMRARIQPHGKRA